MPVSDAWVYGFGRTGAELNSGLDLDQKVLV